MKPTARHYAESLVSAHAAGTRSVEELMKGLMSVLAKRRETHLAPKILAYLIEAEAQKKGTAEVMIETAHPADQATKKKLLARAEKMYPGVTIKVLFSVQPSLSAGFRIWGKEKELDNSFSASIQKLRNQLTRV